MEGPLCSFLHDYQNEMVMLCKRLIPYKFCSFFSCFVVFRHVHPSYWRVYIGFCHYSVHWCRLFYIIKLQCLLSSGRYQVSSRYRFLSSCTFIDAAAGCHRLLNADHPLVEVSGDCGRSRRSLAASSICTLNSYNTLSFIPMIGIILKCDRRIDNLKM